MEAFDVSKCIIVLLMRECFILRRVCYALLLKALLFGNILNCLHFPLSKYFSLEIEKIVLFSLWDKVSSFHWCKIIQ